MRPCTNPHTSRDEFHSHSGKIGIDPLPAEISNHIIVDSILSLAIWWLENPNEYTAEQMAGMLYEALHRRKPPA